MLVRDARGLGVMYAPAARAFTCAAPSASARAELAAYASLPELAALFRTFGPYAAQVLAAHLEQPLAEAMAHLDGQLAALADVLGPVMAAINVRAAAVVVEGGGSGRDSPWRSAIGAGDIDGQGRPMGMSLLCGSTTILRDQAADSQPRATHTTLTPPPNRKPADAASPRSASRSRARPAARARSSPPPSCSAAASACAS